MLDLIYCGEKTIHKIEFHKVSENIVGIKGTLPAKTKGFTLSREGKQDAWDYKAFITIYRELEGEILFSNDGSVYVDPVPKVSFYSNEGGSLLGDTVQEAKDYKDIHIPTPVANENYEFVKWNPDIPNEGKITENKTHTAMFEYVTTLEEVKASKISEMNAIQQAVIQQGVDVTLTDGSVENFTLTDHDQTSLMGLQTQVAQGENQIPWHTSDHAEHCKYYSNADMLLIVTAAMRYVTFHVTYFRDLRIYINAMEDKESVEAVTYGDRIPDEYQSEVLRDMYEEMEV